jgi:hypothetical protein
MNCVWFLDNLFDRLRVAPEKRVNPKPPAGAGEYPYGNIWLTGYNVWCYKKRVLISMMGSGSIPCYVR